MKFENKLIQGKILKRYKRFLADIELEDGQVIVAHTANTGSMKTCWEPGWKVACSYHDDPKRKLKYSLEMTNNNKTWIGVNTGIPNKLTKQVIEDGLIKELSGYNEVKPEVKIGKSRIDLKLSGHPSKPDCFVEVKNVTLWSEGDVALFPDAVSERGQKHLEELIEIKKSGMRACMFYVVQRSDVNYFSPAKEIDPTYAKLLKDAYEAGVEIFCYRFKVTPQKIELDCPLKVVL